MEINVIGAKGWASMETEHLQFCSF